MNVCAAPSRTFTYRIATRVVLVVSRGRQLSRVGGGTEAEWPAPLVTVTATPVGSFVAKPAGATYTVAGIGVVVPPNALPSDTKITISILYE